MRRESACSTAWRPLLRACSGDLLGAAVVVVVVVNRPREEALLREDWRVEAVRAAVVAVPSMREAVVGDLFGLWRPLLGAAMAEVVRWSWSL